MDAIKRQSSKFNRELESSQQFFQVTARILRDRALLVSGILPKSANES